MKKIRPRDAAAVGIIGGQDGPIAIDVKYRIPKAALAALFTVLAASAAGALYALLRRR